MPKMYNPDTQETADAKGREVKDHKDRGFMTVGNRPESEYMGKSREELQADDSNDDATDDGQEHVGGNPDAPGSVDDLDEALQPTTEE